MEIPRGDLVIVEPNTIPEDIKALALDLASTRQTSVYIRKNNSERVFAFCAGADSYHLEGPACSEYYCTRVAEMMPVKEEV